MLSEVRRGYGLSELELRCWPALKHAFFWLMAVEKNPRVDAAAVENGVKQLAIGMQSGQGEANYDKNAGQALHMLDSVESALWDSFQSLPRLPDVSASTALRIADLGCAIGQNTLVAVDRTISNLTALFQARSEPLPQQVQAFFNDLPSNDFNTLFRSFAPYNDSGDANGRRYFAAGAPGSFYGRLFPSKSIHAFTCFTSLHWMSRIPPEIEDEWSPAYNRGHIWYEPSLNTAVREAYSREHVGELISFFKARAEELVSGGLLIATIMASPDKYEDGRTPAHIVLSMHQAVRDLVAEGVVDEQLADRFNLPVLMPRLAEVRTAVDSCPGSFAVHVLQLSDAVSRYPDDVMAQARDDGKVCAKLCNNLCKAVWFSLVEAHFGLETAELLFERNAELLARDPVKVMDSLRVNIVLLVLVAR